jgi:PIN domain nuclease of toxin-antitoxin system
VKFLLDTSAALSLVIKPESLSDPTRSALMDAGNEVYVSVLSLGELASAVDQGRLSLDRHWRSWFRFFTELNGWNVLPITIEVVEEAYSLPEPVHRDPVDRMIIAQARLANMTIVTADPLILDYPHARSVS